MGELKEKVRLLDETPSPRLILVGGSGAAFGVDSCLLEEALPDYHVVNFGMYAALGTSAMLDLSKSRVREGDLVILLPEESPQTFSDFFDPDILWQGLDGAFSLLSDLPAEKQEKLLGAFPSFAAGKLRYTVQGSFPEGGEVYRRSSFNEKGDLVNAACERNIMPGGFDPATPVVLTKELAEESFCQLLNDYASELSGKGAEVFFAFCPANAGGVQAGSPEELYDALSRQLSFPLIGDPRDSLLEPEWFYDTNFHLNLSGRAVYTRALLSSLKAMLGDSSPTQIPLPPAPPLASAAAFTGSDTDAACFLYEGNAITGLTPEGLTREELTVPSRIDGQEILILREGAFAGASSLKEIRIQRNIVSLEDGAFRDCPQLSRILLDQEQPSSCRGGQDLLAGTEALVYVPPASLAAYRTDYFWSLYAGRIFPRTDAD